MSTIYALHILWKTYDKTTTSSYRWDSLATKMSYASQVKHYSKEKWQQGFSSIIDMIDIRCDGDALTTPWAGPFRKIVANSVSLRLKSSHYVSISICCCKSAFNPFHVDLFLFYISVTMLECWSKVWQRTWRKIGYHNIIMTRWCAHTQPYKGVVCQSD